MLNEDFRFVFSDGTILFLNGKPDDENRASYLFHGPRAKIVVTSANAEAAFRDIDGETSRGRFGAGYFAYELNSVFDGIEPRDGNGLLGVWGVYDGYGKFDHGSGRWERIGNFDFPARRLALDAPRVESIEPTISFDEYAAAIGSIHELIRAGSTYQVNFTFPMNLVARGSVEELFLALAAAQPVPYAAHLRWDEVEILSTSPELFFRRDGSRLTMRPMKGTAPRSPRREEDRSIMRALESDPKNRAENVMITDLVRNDLGRVGSDVTVEALCAVEEYPTVWQMTSTVSCALPRARSFSEVLRALFPSGSVTGAPKISTMKIIRDLERWPRGVYCGAIGYLLSEREYRFSVPIRTLERRRGEETWMLPVGSGVTIDSTADEEYRESIQKSKFAANLMGDS